MVRNYCTQLLVAALWMYIINNLCAAQILDFWEPAPRYEVRRFFPKEKDEATTLTDPPRKWPRRQLVSKDKNPKITPINKDQRTSKVIKYRSGTEAFKDKKSKGLRSGKVGRTKADMDMSSSTCKPTGKAEDDEFSAEPMSNFLVDEHDVQIGSTRITPMSLKHQHGEPLKAKGNDKFNGNDNFVISPYSLAEDFRNLLSKFNVAVDEVVLGRTASYNDIVLLKLTEPTMAFRAQDSKYIESDVKEKKIIFIVHGLSSMGLDTLNSLTLGNYLEKLISYYLAHLDKFDIYLMPLANPDGYLQTKSVHYWNKNYSPKGACPGVDLDRNFDVARNSSPDISSCSQHYPGPVAFSEPESVAVRDVLHSMSHKIIAYIHVHAGTYDHSTFKGDAILYPKGFTDIQTDDDKYIDMKGEIEEAMKNANFKILSVNIETLNSWYGFVSGTSVDYASSIYGIPYAMEMVMQVYQEPDLLFKTKLKDEPHGLEYYALTEIWSRIINVTFTTIFKKLENDGQER